MMTPTKGQNCVSPTLRWLVWGVYLLSWSVALLTPQPATWAGDVIPESVVRYSFAKSLHVAAYALLAILTGWLLVPAKLRWLLLGFLSLHAFGTEFLQMFVPSRSGSLKDVGFDHVGICLGIMMTWRWWRPR